MTLTTDTTTAARREFLAEVQSVIPSQAKIIPPLIRYSTTKQKRDVLATIAEQDFESREEFPSIQFD